MKALYYVGPNKLGIKKQSIPAIRPGEVLIKVAFTGICGTDMLAYHGGMPTRVKPSVILGHEFSGTIQKVTAGSQFQVGEQVTVEPLITCGECPGCKSGEYNLCRVLNLIGIDSDGGMAQYISVPETKVYRLGPSISMETGALIEPLAVCVHLLNKGKVTANQTVLIVGGGPIGLITALVARQKGAEVIISEINPFRIQMGREMGFVVINPSEHDFQDKIKDRTNGRGADVSVEATGTNIGLVSCIEGTCVQGTVVIAGLPKKNADFDTYRIIAKELNLVGTRVYKQEDYIEAIELLNQKKIDLEPIISRVVALEDAIEKGFEAIDRGEDVIKILISIPDEDEN
jgi:(R,R)-butanediol dehydrogenase / meso-butanediol dehydrogenase / diacetyl reductase